MEKTHASVPLLTSVAAVVRAKELSFTDAGEVIDSFIGIAASRTVWSAVRRLDYRLLRRIVALQRPDRPRDVINALDDVAEWGNVEILELLYPYHPVVESSGEEASDSVPQTKSAEPAAAKTPANIMEWVLKWGKSDSLPYLIAVAVMSQRVDVAKWMLARLPPSCTSMHVDRLDQGGRHITAMEAAAMHGRLDLLEMFHESGVTGWTVHAMVKAAEAGHLDVVKWLLAHRPDDEWRAGYYQKVVLNGHLEVVQLLHSNGVNNFGDCVSEALQSGSLQMIKWVHEQYPDEFRSTRNALDGALWSGHVDVLKYLEQCNVELGRIRPDQMDTAASSGHLDLIKWVYEHRTKNERCTMIGLSNAAGHGHLAVVKYLHEHGVNTAWGPFRNKEYDHLSDAARNGHLEVVKFILNHDMLVYSDSELGHQQANDTTGGASSVPVKRTVACTTKVMDAAAVSGNLGVVQYLHETRTEGCTTQAMNVAAFLGHLDIVKYLHENRTEGCTTKAMDDAAYKGHLDVVKYLHEHRTEGCTTDAMDKAAGNGDLAIVQFLFANRSEGCTTNALRWAMEEHRTDVVQWLRGTLPEGYMKEAADPSADFF